MQPHLKKNSKVDDIMNNTRLHRILQQTIILGEDVLNQVPILECNEPLVDITTVIPNVIIRMSNMRREYAINGVLFARKTVGKMIARVVENISSTYQFIVFDAYRPIEYQRLRFEQVYKSLKANHPSRDDDYIRRLAFEIIFPPNEDPQQPPPHATGGAVDVALATLKGELLDFGSAYGIYNEDENKRHLTNSTMINTEQRKNREILIIAMVNAGFSNYPGEWWHFMFGDREYAAYEGFPNAIYGRADLIGK